MSTSTLTDLLNALERFLFWVDGLFPGYGVLPSVVLVVVLVIAARLSLQDDQPKRRRRTKEQRRALWRRDGGKCYYCRRSVPFEDAHFDHVEPISQGGSDNDNNLRLAHPHCNLHKGARTPQQAKMATADDSDRSWIVLVLMIVAGLYLAIQNRWI